jgi:uncharacterized membrane protein YkgB
MFMDVKSLDQKIINFFKRISVPVSRFGLFLIFFWFGALKVLDLSPASQMVQNLLVETFPFLTFHIFFALFGLFEMVIGILFMIKGMERIVIPLLFIHMITTLGPLFLLPSETWSGFLVPTLEGQYIIKNIALVGLAIGIAANLHAVKSFKQMI